MPSLSLAVLRGIPAAMVLAVLVAAAFLLSACGSDGDDEPAATPTSADSEADAELHAIELTPDLTGSGFNQTTPETIPNTGQLDIAFSVYEKTAPTVIQARAEVRVYPTVEIADEDFELQAQGWKAPPPGLFGGDPGNVDSPSLNGLDEAVAYIATNRDPQGVRLWTDVFRVGRVIVVAHVLGQEEGDVVPVREAIAESVRAKLP